MSNIYNPIISGTKYFVPSGNMGKLNRRNPYVPIFSSTAARITEPAVGASTWASGSHVWNGNIGTLMANPTKNARNTQYWKLNGKYEPIAWNASTSNVEPAPNAWVISGCRAAIAGYMKYRASIPSSSRTEPTSVYRKNLMAAYSFLGPPQTPM